MFNSPTLRSCFTISFILFGVINIVSQEICNDCIDNDNDGLVDCYDPECYISLSCDSFYIQIIDPDTNCRIYPLNPDSIGIKKLWETSTVVDTRNTTVVGDIDGDGTPEVFSHNTSLNQLYVFNGSTGALKFAINSPTINALNDGVAIGDVDKDGFAEIFIINSDAFLRSYNYLGSLLWVSMVTADEARQRPNLANFNGDDTVEVYVGNQIYNASTGRLVAQGSGSKGSHNNIDAYPAAADVLEYNATTCPDCDGLELICGNQVYGVDISSGVLTVRATAPVGLTDGFTSIADFNGDNLLDIIVSMGGACRVYVWDPRTTGQIGTTFSFAANGSGGHANVGNYDSDSDLEIGIAGSDQYLLIDNNMTVKWQQEIHDASSHITGSSAFDFNCDDILEIVYRDEDSIYIFDGPTGLKIASEKCGSQTRTELPVIVDVDGDGQANIVCSCAGTSQAQGTVVAWSSMNNAWPTTRKVFNQHSYFTVNVNDDLSIPCVQQDHANSLLPAWLNSYLNQMPLMDEQGNSICYKLLPDANVFISCKENGIENNDSIEVQVVVCNAASDESLQMETPISLYINDPLAGGSLIDNFATNGSIPPGQCDTFYRYVPVGEYELYAYVNDSGNIPLAAPHIKHKECYYSNNFDSEVLKCFPVKIPNIITANGDGVNDLFVIRNLPLGSRLQIFNRWGEMIYENQNYFNDWSGITSGGKRVTDGVYYYLLDIEQEQVVKSGFITVVGF